MANFVLVQTYSGEALDGIDQLWLEQLKASRQAREVVDEDSSLVRDVSDMAAWPVERKLDELFLARVPSNTLSENAPGMPYFTVQLQRDDNGKPYIELRVVLPGDMTSPDAEALARKHKLLPVVENLDLVESEVVEHSSHKADATEDQQPTLE